MSKSEYEIQFNVESILETFRINTSDYIRKQFHDLMGSDIVGISWFVELLERKPLRERQRNYLDELVGYSRSCQESLNDVHSSYKNGKFRENDKEAYNSLNHLIENLFVFKSFFPLTEKFSCHSNEILEEIGTIDKTAREFINQANMCFSKSNTVAYLKDEVEKSIGKKCPYLLAPSDHLIRIEYSIDIDRDIEIKNGFVNNVSVTLTDNSADHGFNPRRDIQNRLKNPNFKPIIEIKGRKMDGLLNYVVADNGFGMREEDKERLFKRGFSTKNDIRTEHGVYGLWYAKKYVEEMGGDMWVESRLGEGTEFHVTTPLDKI